MIDSGCWVNSQSGRRKQDFGPKANFKKKKAKLGSFAGMPRVMFPLYERIKRTHKILEDYAPVECLFLEYEPDKGAHIDPHFDDNWLWGECIMSLSLLSDSVMTLSRETPGRLEEIPVKIPARSLLVLSGESRHVLKHSIKKEFANTNNDNIYLTCA